jgi:hypothetical protein
MGPPSSWRTQRPSADSTNELHGGSRGNLTALMASTAAFVIAAV